MRIIRIHIILILMVCNLTALLAQDDYVLDKDSIKVKDRLHYNFTMGAGFGYSSNAGDFFSTYYSPSVTYDVSSRFSIKTGLTYANSTVNNYPVIADYNYQFFSGNISQYYAFVEGNYKVSEKLTVGGSVFYDFTEYKNILGEKYKAGNGLSNVGYSAHFQYKLSESMTVEGGISVNDRSPFGNSFMGRAEHTFFGR